MALFPLEHSLNTLAELAGKPLLFARTPALFWDDPHISGQMLAAHLDPSHDVASRRPEMIERSVGWIISYLGLQPGMRLLDLGCGPGLYCRRFAQAGLAVTGIDYSRRSIEYATADAREHGLSITYQYQNYLELSYEAAFDAICLIWCDFGALTDDERAELLPRIHRTLKPGGVFVFDVLMLNHLAGLTEARRWEVQPTGGFWHAGPYVELQQTFLYPEADTDLAQYLILTDQGVTPYHIWNRSFTPEGIGTLLASAGLTVESHWNDLTGQPWEDESPHMGVIARK